MSVSAAQSNKFKPGVMTSYSSSNKKNSIHSNTAAKNSMAKSIFNADKAVKSKQFLSTSAAGHVGANRISNSAPRYMNGREASIMFNSNRGSGQVTAFSTNNYMNSGFGMPSFGMGGMNTIDTIMTLTNFGLGVADRLGLFNKSTPTKQMSQGNVLTNKLNDLGRNITNTNTNATTTDVSLTLSNMASCNDATSLAAAITNAENKLGLMNTEYTNLASQKTEAQNMKSQIEQQKGTAVEEQTKAKGNVSKCETGVSDAKGAREEALNNTQVKNEDYNNAVKEYTQAHDAHKDAEIAKQSAQTHADEAKNKYTQATAATQSAQSEYDKCPDYIENNGVKIANPQKSILKAKLEQAKAAETQAKNADEAAQKALKEATAQEAKTANAEKEAEAKKQKAYDKLGEAQKDADKYEAALKTAQKDLDNAKDNLQTAQKNLEDVNTKVADFDQQLNAQDGIISVIDKFAEDKERLSTEINSQKERLTEMQNKSNPDNKTSLPEMGQNLTAEQKQNLTEQGDGFTKGGKDYKHYKTSDGQDVYTVGDKRIDPKTFNSEKDLVPMAQDITVHRQSHDDIT